MSTNQVKLLGLSKLKREFLKQNWKGTKIKNKMRSAMLNAARPIRKDVRNAVRSAGFSSSAASRFASTYGFNKIGHSGPAFGINLSPRLAGKPRRRGKEVRTSGGLDMRYIINFHARKINMPNPSTKPIEDAQLEFIQKLWSKGQLK